MLLSNLKVNKICKDVLLNGRAHEISDDISVLRDELDGRQKHSRPCLAVQKRSRADDRQPWRSRRKPEADGEVFVKDPDDEDHDNEQNRRHFE